MKLQTKIRINLIAFFRTSVRLRNNNSTLHGIIFSKDRPLQLFALLESYCANCYDIKPLTIIYKASEEGYNNAYNEVFSYFSEKIELHPIQETIFHDTAITVLEKIKSTYIFFLVDDNLFTRQFRFSNYLDLKNRNHYIFSLRLGMNLNYCYTKQKKQEKPKFNNIGRLISWKWNKGEHDWQYVFSVDGNIFNKNTVLEMSKLVPFKAPNSYEANMNIFRYILKRKKGLCYEDSVLINLCINRVQDEVKNISGDISVEELLTYWHQNKKININQFRDISNRSAHIEMDNLPLINR